MRGIISGIKRMEIHDGDGIRATVFFKGCPLCCLWCHNPESLSFEGQTAYFKEKCMQCGLCKGERNQTVARQCPTEALVHYGKEMKVEELVEILLQDKGYYDNSGGGVTLSGGECLAQIDFAEELAKSLKEKGVSVYIDTCGFVSRENLKRILPYADAFLYDVKAIDPQVHKKCTGQENGLILENLRYLSEQGSKIEIRYPLVKGYNDGECEKIGAFLQGLAGITKVKVLQYHRFSGSRYEALGMPCTLPEAETTYEDVAKAVELLRTYGLNAINGVDEN